MSNWSNVFGSMNYHVMIRNPRLEFSEIENKLKQYFGQTYSAYDSSNFKEMDDKCRIPFGSEGSLYYRVVDISEPSEFNKNLNHALTFEGKSTVQKIVAVVFDGDLRDSNLLSTREFETWLRSLNVDLFDNDFDVSLQSFVFNVEEESTESFQTFAWHRYMNDDCVRESTTGEKFVNL